MTERVFGHYAMAISTQPPVQSSVARRRSRARQTARVLGSVARTAVQLARWRLHWNSYDLEYVPGGLGTNFMNARDAVGLIPDGATVISTGMAANQRPSILYRAVSDRFAETGHPRELTWCAVGAVGSRGRSPGSLEECSAPGLVTAFIAGHLETVTAFLAAGERGKMQLHTLPQGEMAFLIEGQAEGRSDRVSEVGVGTFLDPRVGDGSAVTPQPTFQLVSVEDADHLRYRLPPLDVAIINTPYADADGNLYVRDASCLSEIHDAARAVHANGGQVIVTVADVIDRDPSSIYLPTEAVDAIVVRPRNEQVASIPQRRAWTTFSVGEDVDEERALLDLHMMNSLSGVIPHRTAADRVLARLAASVITESIDPGAVINIGTGLPEEASRLLYEAGLAKGLTQTSEAGVWGGIPASGICFGASVNPVRQESSSWMFHRYAERLDLTCLGLLEVDSEGNVNVSRRGERTSQYVGPGGLPNIVHEARTVIFVGAFETHAKLHVRGGRLTVDRPGLPKFIDHVREITFNGQMALERGKDVWYATHLGLFHLSDGGIELVMVMPGVDVQRDVLQRATARILLPAGGPTAVRVVPSAIVTGAGFRLEWGAHPLNLREE
jgi:propionate CoA-transferase